MIKRKLKPFVIPSLYAVILVLFVASIYFIQSTVTKIFSKEEINTDYVDEEIIESEDYLPVVNTDIKIAKPYLDENVKIAKSYYDYQAEAEKQQNSIIYYENIYMQNSGVDYSADSSFDVVAILDGTVISVEETDMLGYSVQIRHNNDIISVYQSLSEVNVKVDEKVIQGQKIAKSGESNIGKELGNHLHFEFYYQGIIVNPEEYYDKSLNEL